MPIRSKLLAALFSLSLTCVQTSAALAENQTQPVRFIEDYAAQYNQQLDIDITDRLSVFDFLFSHLPGKVTVLPTEGYYYFQFYHDGAHFAGNMRLDIKDRDDGILHFAYYSVVSEYGQEFISNYKPLNAEDGVKVTKIDDLNYSISFAEKTVDFALNDLRDQKPKTNQLAPDEVLIGPMWDESGIPLFLVHNPKDRYFLYVLNENGFVPEVYVPHNYASDIVIGSRTAFGYYNDQVHDRKILIGVKSSNVEGNNYYDGPFDQLPDNFIKGDSLKDALELVYPDLKGQIDRYGNFNDFEGRFVIDAYHIYETSDELIAHQDCKDQGLVGGPLYQCLSFAGFEQTYEDLDAETLTSDETLSEEPEADKPVQDEQVAPQSKPKEDQESKKTE